MADYTFYRSVYLGDSIPMETFSRLARRAEDQLAVYKRNYTVTAPEANSVDMASCAMADALYYFETAANTPQSTSIGSVSSSQGTAVDISPKAQAAELYRCAKLHLDFYRGC